VIARRYGVSKEAVRQWMAKFEEFFASRPLSKKK
jgi:transposase-like protein